MTKEVSDPTLYVDEVLEGDVSSKRHSMGVPAQGKTPECEIKVQGLQRRVR